MRKNNQTIYLSLYYLYKTYKQQETKLIAFWTV